MAVEIFAQEEQVVEVTVKEEQADVDVDNGVYVITRTGGVGGVSARIAEITLLSDQWIGTKSPYSQIVEIDGITENSQVDLTPSVEQLMIFYEKDLAFVTENDGGVVTVFAIGQKPEKDYTMQVTITEVAT